MLCQVGDFNGSANYTLILQFLAILSSEEGVEMGNHGHNCAICTCPLLNCSIPSVLGAPFWLACTHKIALTMY